ncbi:MAG: hypothetical protein WCP93_00990 [Candidatus Berkelbacteria bacterium]
MKNTLLAAILMAIMTLIIGSTCFAAEAAWTTKGKPACFDDLNTNLNFNQNPANPPANPTYIPVKGDQGDQGPKGDKGEPGKTIVKTVVKYAHAHRNHTSTSIGHEKVYQELKKWKIASQGDIDRKIAEQKSIDKKDGKSENKPDTTVTKESQPQEKKMSETLIGFIAALIFIAAVSITLVMLNNAKEAAVLKAEAAKLEAAEKERKEAAAERERIAREDRLERERKEATINEIKWTMAGNIVSKQFSQKNDQEVENSANIIGIGNFSSKSSPVRITSDRSDTTTDATGDAGGAISDI